MMFTQRLIVEGFLRAASTSDMLGGEEKSVMTVGLIIELADTASCNVVFAYMLTMFTLEFIQKIELGISSQVGWLQIEMILLIADKPHAGFGSVLERTQTRNFHTEKQLFRQRLFCW